ncbi:MAG: protein-disulfide reductase DsbD domain-containing protein [Acidobacteriaceae bacterium]
MVAWIFAIGIACAAAMMAQSAWQPSPRGIGFGQARSRQWVQMVSSPQLAVQACGKASKPKDIELRFTIQNGLHINSHTPHSPFLIPTTLTLDKTPGVQIAQVDYPQGVDYHFAFSPKDALSVYTGQFAVLVRVHAQAGHHTLHGQLRYQACDDRACNPPQTLPLQLDVTAR